MDRLRTTKYSLDELAAKGEDIYNKIRNEVEEKHHGLFIAKTTQKPPETEATIEMETLEDLAKIAEILARPILHTTKDIEHIFYIIENNTKYQYKTTTPTKT